MTRPEQLSEIAMLVRFIRRLFIFAILSALGACGGSGGTNIAGISSGGTGGIASGPITGFGSVIVNGVEFDDTLAQVTINGVADRPVGELKLGMVVEVSGTIDPARGTGKAESITASRVALGPLSAIDLAAGGFTVLGQRVMANAGTVYEGAAGLPDLLAGDLVEVSSLDDMASGVQVATRIERHPQPIPGAILLEVQGAVGALAATTFQIGTQTVNYSGANLSDIPAGGLANGLKVRVQASQLPAGGVLAATRVQGVAEASIATGTRVEIEGFVSSYISPANFRVGAQVVNASGAQFVNGTAADLANGKRIEIEGIVAGAIVNASKIEFLAVNQETAMEVEGPITDFLSPANFKVRDQLVDASLATFQDGTAADLANARVVHVKGTTGGSVLRATQVAYVDTSPSDGERMTVQGLIGEFISSVNFKVNGQAVTTTAATVFSGGSAASLANGVRVTAEGTVRNGILGAVAITITPPEMSQTVTIEGRITAFVSQASFKVNGQAIATGAQTLYQGGTAARLANGVRISVTGTLNGGILSAGKIVFKPDDHNGDSRVEVEGYITNFVAVSNFKVNGQVVDASAAVFEGGKAADLANGLKVHATGSIAGGILKAAKIEISR